MLFQKSAWDDTKAMMAWALYFIGHVRLTHGDASVLLYCNNLIAHVNIEVRCAFRGGKVF